MSNSEVINISEAELTGNMMTSHIIHLLDELTDEQLLEVLNKYCRGCGSKKLPCHCDNDE